MSRIELAPEVGDDFDRILDLYPVENPLLRIREIIEAINVLEHNPLIGRPVNNDKRELVIGRRSHGYVALYRYLGVIGPQSGAGAAYFRRAIGLGSNCPPIRTNRAIHPCK